MAGIIGLILLIGGIALFFVQRHQKQKAFSLKIARKVTAAELNDTASGVAAEIGGGSWRDYVKVWGKIQVDEPLISEHTRQKCVYYCSKVLREYEDTTTERNSEGRLETKTQRKTETISSNKQSIPFTLVDDSGTVEVNPESADIETVEVMNEFRRETKGRRNTLGYRYQESLLPLNRNILVLGAASDLTGRVVISKPTKADTKYVISLKDEETLSAAVERNAKISFFSMVACGIVGILLVLWQLLS
ncbi:E3 ubiquitin ligase family protein [Leptolyngbya sp. PCC 6406]|uniref:E3 ubiquitin ligase family protein n=1 Tax=Leptolyngbya sp. PCC 6406 TaxID=1173264 RepID=UPI0002ACCB22|nr:E3 ubiquitin ligase family protein [Leptolyngbya sp. PCC 6406]